MLRGLFVGTLDIWEDMHIATNADAKSAHKTVACASVSLTLSEHGTNMPDTPRNPAPLRLVGEELGVPVTTLSHARDCWKSYTVSMASCKCTFPAR